MAATYERATECYDHEHEAEPVTAVISAIFTTSKVSDVSAVVLRTGEAANALVTALSLVLAISQAFMRSPTAIRKTVEEVRKRLTERVPEASKSPDIADFKRHCFGDESEGHA